MRPEIPIVGFLRSWACTGRRWRSTPRPYDDGHEREALACDRAAWKAVGFISSASAGRWERRLHRLAKATGLRPAEVRAEIDADAALIHDAKVTAE